MIFNEKQINDFVATMESNTNHFNLHALNQSIGHLLPGETLSIMYVDKDREMFKSIINNMNNIYIVTRFEKEVLASTIIQQIENHTGNFSVVVIDANISSLEAIHLRRYIQQRKDISCIIGIELEKVDITEEEFVNIKDSNNITGSDNLTYVWEKEYHVYTPMCFDSVKIRNCGGKILMDVSEYELNTKQYELINRDNEIIDCVPYVPAQNNNAAKALAVLKALKGGK